jgi:putative membrane protein
MRISQKSFLYLLLGAVALAPTAALADGPRDFLQQALQGDNSEIMLGRMAADRARSPDVRDFAKSLVSDHSEARDDVLRVGRGMGIRPSRDIAPEAREERDRLSGMDGREFDREFVRYMVDDHRKDVAAFGDEAREHHGPVSDLARRQLPTLQKHLDMAEGLDRRDEHRGRNDDRARDNGGDRQDRDGGGDRRDR